MKILVAGDYVPFRGFSDCLVEGQTEYDYNIIREFTDRVDYSILNLEAPIVRGDEKPICKFGPNLKAPLNSLNGVVGMGFNAVTLASNHFRDYGDDGIINTISLLDNAGLDHVGGGRSFQEARKVLIKSINEKNIAFVNCCEHEFSVASSEHGGSMPLDIVEISRLIKEARKKNDYVVVIIHGGNEWYQLPSPRMKRLYRFFVEMGADAVINHHQHCYSGYEFYQGKPIIYGLGNFIFDNPSRRKMPWNEGCLAILDFNNSIEIELIPYRQCDDKPGAYPMKGHERDSFFNNIEYLNSIIEDDAKLNAEFDEFMLEKHRGVYSLIGPFTNKYLRGLVNRGITPSFISKKKAAMLYDFICCEAHRDVTINALEFMLK